jgi:osmotically-inducible protein OsmY
MQKVGNSAMTTSKILLLSLSLVILATFNSACVKGIKGMTGEERSMDVMIGSEVRVRLAQDPVTKAAGIRVAVFEAHVTLNGVLPDEEAVERALNIARNAKGVKSVINNLEIKRAEPPE